MTGAGTIGTTTATSGVSADSTVTSGVIELAGVSRWYGNVVAVNDITMSIGPGVTGLLGPNGAGKSTILHMIAGFLEPSKGTLTVNGAPTTKNPDIYHSLGLVPERDSVYAFLTGEQFVRASAKLQKLPDIARATKTAIDLTEMRDAKDRKISTYSKGMRQRIKVAAALVHDPEILLLDEPFNGMDPRQRLHMMDLLSRLGEQGRTILFSSHILEDVEKLAEMTSRPHVFSVRSSDDRTLAAALVSAPYTSAVELSGKGMQVRVSDFGAFCARIAPLSREHGITLRELRPADESLESVFGYLISA
jgi:ABC-2 type transport system ATP-binding protein